MAPQLTLSQPGGADYAHHITTGTPGFSNLPTALLSMRRSQLLFRSEFLKYSKGQLISKGLFGFFNSSEKRTKISAQLARAKIKIFRD